MVYTKRQVYEAQKYIEYKNSKYNKLGDMNLLK